jgi:dipeptidyl aminopeptidase/acylaminoacyl peptidase
MFYFFPGNHAWSQAVLRMLFTGASIWEVAAAVDELSAIQAPAADDWMNVWTDVGRRLRRRADEQASEGHHHSARKTYLRSATYSQYATAFIDHSREDRRAAHRESVAAFGRFAMLSRPQIEYVEVPYEGGSFPAWFVPPSTGSSTVRAPATIYLPGWDGTKEQGIELALELAGRGFGVLLCDGPGNGEAVLFRGLLNRFDYEVPGTAAFNYLAARPDVDANRISVVGPSLGAYRAGRVAAFEHRLAAAVAWGSIWDFGAVWARYLSHPREGVPTPLSHATFVLGLGSAEEVSRELARWTLADVAPRITCPFLIVHGERDVLVPLTEAERFHSAVGSHDKELKVFYSTDGGDVHCQNDNRTLAHDFIADWLSDLSGLEHRGGGDE